MLDLMNSPGVLARLWKHLRPAAYAALGGTIFAAPVPLVLMTFLTGATDAFGSGLSATPSVGSVILGALWMGMIAFIAGAAYLLVVGFPTLLLMWLVRLRHPIFPTLFAALVSFVSSRPGDRELWVLFGVSTGLVAGIYARRCGHDALQKWQQ